MKKISVTFDFDDTLSRTEVQDYARELVARGIDVWILTARYHELKKHQYLPSPTNDDLYKVADDVRIPRDRIIFTNLELKMNFLQGSSVLWHLDDKKEELISITEVSNVIAIDSLKDNWKEQCEGVLLGYQVLLNPNEKHGIEAENS